MRGNTDKRPSHCLVFWSRNFKCKYSKRNGQEGIMSTGKKALLFNKIEDANYKIILLSALDLE